MRILHVEKMLFYDSGVTSYVRALSDLQRRRGNDVFFFSCTRPEDRSSPLRYFDFTRTGNPIHLVRMIHNSQAASELNRFLRKNPIDIAHVHNIYHHLTPSVLGVLQDRRIPIVMTVHDYRLVCPTKHFLRPSCTNDSQQAGEVCFRCLPNRFYHAIGCTCSGLASHRGRLAGVGLAIESYYQRFFRRYYQPIEIFFCPTRFMRDTLVKASLPASKAVVLPNIIEPICLPADVEQLERELLFISRLTPEKSPGLMLELAQRLRDVHVTIVGDGPLLDSLRRAIERRQLSNVSLVGHLRHDRLGRFLKRSSAVVLTSRWIENSPQVMLEAMWAARCVIVPDTEPLREWVVDGRTGRVFRPGDADSLVEVVLEVLDDPSGRDRMAEAGRAMVRKRHDPKKVIVKLEGYYQEAIRRCELRW